MTKSQCFIGSAVVAFCMVACSNEDVGEIAIEARGSVAANGDQVQTASAPDYVAAVTDPGSPYGISYRIIGSPIAGSPVTVSLRVEAAPGAMPVTLEYRINDASSMTFSESQLTRLQTEPPAGENFVTLQVTVVPQREGRLYLNVSASFETGNGARSTLAAIPIEVAAGGGDPVEAGVPAPSEDGDSVAAKSPE